MRIFLTSWGYPTDNNKGNPFVKEIAEALARRGVEVVIIVVVFKGLSAFFKGHKENWLKSDLLELREVKIRNFIPSFFGLGKLRRYLSKYQMTSELEKISFELGMPDAFQFHYILHSTAWLYTDFLQKKEIRYTLFEHSPGSAFIQGVSRNFGGFSNLSELKSFVQGASLRLARIRKYEIKLSELYAAKFHSLPSFVSTEFTNLAHASIKQKATINKEFTYISLGSFTENKGFDLLIESFVKAFRDENQIKLKIVGDGQLLNDLRLRVTQLGMNDRIALPGVVAKKKVFALIDEADAVVISSAWETFGNTAIEGMMMGKPILSTKCDGPETIITEATGILCDRNEESISSALIWMYKNHNSFESSEIAEHCKKKYSEEAVLDQLSIYYKKSFGLDF